MNWDEAEKELEDIVSGFLGKQLTADSLKEIQSHVNSYLSHKFSKDLLIVLPDPWEDGKIVVVRVEDLDTYKRLKELRDIGPEHVKSALVRCGDGEIRLMTSTTVADKTQHTPVPWDFREEGGHAIRIGGFENNIRSRVGTFGSISSKNKANAAFTVKAVNHHDALAGALSALVEDCKGRGIPDTAEDGYEAYYEAEKVLKSLGKDKET